MNNYDVIVIGSGPGGYVAAIRCAQLGMKTAIIEKYDTLGGTCLNVGCIPSKSLLDSSEHFYTALHHFKQHGIQIDSPKVDIQQMIARKNSVVEQTCAGVQFLMDKNKIDVHHGVGSFVSPTQINVTNKQGEKKVLTTKDTIIATGSKPLYFQGMQPDKKRIITSTEALNLQEIPKKMIVIGAGVIGLELGSVYQRLGTQIEIVEASPKILPTMDESISKELTKILKKQGLKFHFEHSVQQVVNNGDSVTLTALNKKNESVHLDADYVLIAVGRKPYTDALGLENIGLETTSKGQIPVNDSLQTPIPTVYAIGDVVRGTMLAHKAEEEAVFVAETIAKQRPHIQYDLIPSVVYTWPEVASVGKTEQELKTAGKDIKTGIFPIKALGRARASMDISGQVKIIADRQTDEILGVHMIAPRAADLIMEAVVAMEFRASAEDIARICHPHPTYTEAVKEAALDASEQRAIHI